MKVNSLKSRIILISGLITVLLVVALSVANNLTQQELNAYHSERAVKSKFVLWRKIVNEQISAMEAELFALTRNKAALEALANRDRDSLASAIKPMFNRLSATKTVSALVVSDASGNALFASDSSVSSVSSDLVEKALRGGKLERGIVSSKKGEMFTSFVFPIYSKPGKPIGTGVLLNHLQPALNEFKENDSAEVFVLDENGNVKYKTNSSLLSEVDYELPKLGEATLSEARAQEGIYSVAIHRVRTNSTYPVTW